MNRFKAFAAALALGGAALVAPCANAASIVIDFTGAFSVDEFGDPDNVSSFVDIGAGSQVTGISYDLTLAAVTPSWLSEMYIFFGRPDISAGLVLTPAAGDDMPGAGAYSGSINLVDLGLDFSVLGDGLLYIELYEDFDDYPDEFDGAYLSGSVTITYEPVVVEPGIPEPATWAMMIGGLALAGASLRRARRTVAVSFA